MLVMNMNPHTGFRVWGLGFRPQVLATHKYTHADSLLHSKKGKKKKRGLKCWQCTTQHTQTHGEPASLKKKKKRGLKLQENRERKKEKNVSLSLSLSISRCSDAGLIKTKGKTSKVKRKQEKEKEKEKECTSRCSATDALIAG